jgi:hypothetical protein
MNDIFPQVSTVLLAEATPGSIIRVPRYGESIIALVSDESIDEIRSIVMLNARIQGLSKVVFSRKWRLDDGPYLCYRGKIRFEIGMDPTGIDERGQHWWETPGVLVSIGDQLFIRAAPTECGYSTSLINVQTGAVFSAKPPSRSCTFGSWELCVRDELTDRCIELYRFKISKQA